MSCKNFTDMRVHKYNNIEHNILGADVNSLNERMRFIFDEIPDGLDDLGRLREFERECMNEANNYLEKYNRRNGTELCVWNPEFFVSGYSYCFEIATGRGYLFSN